jgi:hypothetical protein
MSRVRFPKIRSTALFIDVSRRNVIPLSPLQSRTSSGRTIATKSSSKQPNPFEKPAEAIYSMQEHKPQPTESQEDVAADRSAIDPLHRLNPTESQENVMADRSPDDPLQQTVPF